ncbi:MAG: fumarylacetoacetate hydrolase family protein [Rhodospirillaceae bacterium]|jgi:2-keto-4-pentenoate hydratase/2-oxohepta-3-ene-1,7-dioic acid hydratase in catechol pathway|nr:fumarylacetoacetate hydrolase family protein [Rhodospirillaceae bacterium]MBT4115693.1 fumarylacetoacetate hydrolase family protein [Rhodospirillaceae bacterium]MBT4673412.1 fumarylacetoacetate hydrolase family protein [Rhodospirillaceae bacterium]MBT4721809.1 fumarylacetoacetate hydrolase family protein [Rhodospirillaceae bacterium]MBT4749158.1 fumarylacetoacetate hydrolase family protein [Rhodospirillaceae bacterium]
MKLLTIDAPRGGRPGALSAKGEIIDLLKVDAGEGLGNWLPDTVRGILDAGAEGLDMVRRLVDRIDNASGAEADRIAASGALLPFGDTPLLAPIPEPRLILSEGRNYGKHLAEMGGEQPTATPTAFIKLQSSLTGSGKPIYVPPQYPDQIDYEGEFTIVIGRNCHRVSEEDALDYIAGYTIVNDVSARDWIPEYRAATDKIDICIGWERNIMGKNLPSFSPCGPVITTADEIPDPHDLQLTTRLNGEVMQSTKTDDLVHNVPQMVSYYSQWYLLQPGDLITTGSPAGVGVGRNPPVFMKDGDLIEVEIERIGTLSNRLEAQV